ncbi:Hypothetical predicted protein [Octopus vulgaris]|uniref:Uncharacterized protein n=1 Tax=Octopus vulgaris TaxID=6645 RepID=A0AA36AJI1_OCTVU|nr:Hypothetical predicted protein [Octopus vulgaris]
MISSYSKMSSRYYLPMRHDVVAKTIYNAIRRKDCLRINIENTPVTEYVPHRQHKKYWWNIPKKTSVKCKHSKPDIGVWEKQEKVLTAIEISCPVDGNISLKIKEKELRTTTSKRPASITSLHIYIYTNDN